MRIINTNHIGERIEILTKLQREFPNNEEIRIRIIELKEIVERYSEEI